MKYNLFFFLTLFATILYGQSSSQEMDAVGEYKVPGGINYAGIASCSGDMYIVSLPSLYIHDRKIPEGTIVTFTATTTNTAASKLMVTNGKKSSLAFPIYKFKTEELGGMDISAGRLVMVLFQKDRFHLIIKNNDLVDFLVNCNGLWVSTKGNQNFCGDCNIKCAEGETCFDGRCITPTSKSETSCENANLKTDENNCGTCGNSCPPGFLCDKGQCKIACPLGFVNCNFDCVKLKINSKNCGACGLECPKGFSCEDGECIPICPSGTLLCKGVCVNFASDVKNCGDCGRTCPPGQICVGTKCQ